MDPLTRLLMQGAAGAGGEVLGIEDVFSTWLYTGNGSTQTITNGIDLSGKGGLVWIKGRAASTHRLIDTVRGATKRLETNGTTAEVTDSSGLTAFNSDGFTLGSGGDYNDITLKFTSWTFRKAAKFFDVVTWTTTGSPQRVSHNLGTTPGTILVKATSTTGTWYVWHRSLSSATNSYLDLSSTAAVATIGNLWGSTGPTSTDFGVPQVAAGQTWVAYLFAHDTGTDGLIQCGTMTGATTVNLGWEPQWLLVKSTSTTGDWQLFDTMRGLKADDATQAPLVPNTSAAEATSGSYGYRLTPTGFYSGNGGTYIYIAIRRGPMRTPTDATKVFETSAVAVDTSIGANTSFPVDVAFDLARTAGGGKAVLSRLTGTQWLQTQSTAAESSGASVWYPYNTFFYPPGIFGASAVYELFRRAPGFFDVVAYTGTGSARTVSHNLGVAPELIITKVRNTAGSSWGVDYVASNLGGFLNVNSAFSSGMLWNNGITGTSINTTFSGAIINASGSTYIAYLFATCPGVSKCFNYTGTGTTKQIDCGFTNGARLVLIKRTDSTGDWYIWDSARGIISGNDPYLLLNSTAAEVTNTDYIDPYSAGFEISSTAPAAINANGGSYIGLAIA